MTKRTRPARKNPGGMRRIDITDKEVKRIPFNSGGYLDKTMPGFILISNATGMSYVYQRKMNGSSVRVNLGRVGMVSATQARDEATASIA